MLIVEPKVNSLPSKSQIVNALENASDTWELQATEKINERLQGLMANKCAFFLICKTVEPMAKI